MKSTLARFVLLALSLFSSFAVADPTADWKELFHRDLRQACRYPGTYEGLRQRGSVEGRPIEELCPTLPIFDRSYRAMKVPLNRIAGFDYVIAGRGEDFASRWGHAMVRLRFCAPAEKPDAPCKEEPYSSLMSGYAAFSDEGSYNPLKGLSGGYPTIVTFEMDEIAKDRYANDELRDVEYHPVHASREQNILLAAFLVEAYWNHRSNYSFLTNNCASEIVKLLKKTFPDIAKLQQAWERFESPAQVVRLLESVKLADARETVVHTSEMPWLLKYLTEFKLKIHSMKEYANTPAKLRGQWQERSREQGGSAQRWSHLETLQVKSLSKQYESRLMNLIQKKEHLKCPNADSAYAQAAAETLRTMTPRFLKLGQGNSVPDISEIPANAELTARLKDFQSRKNAMVDCLKNDIQLQKITQELQDTQDNLQKLWKTQFAN